jgi:hypothetical protein
MKKLIIITLLLVACSKPQIKHAPIEPIRQDIIGNIKLLPVWYVSKEECEQNPMQCIYMDSASAYNNAYNYKVLKTSLKKFSVYSDLTEKAMDEHNKINK